VEAQEFRATGEGS